MDIPTVLPESETSVNIDMEPLSDALTELERMIHSQINEYRFVCHTPELQAATRRVIDTFVKVYEQDPEPGKKPLYSYSELSFLALLRSPSFCLPVTEIYR